MFVVEIILRIIIITVSWKHINFLGYFLCIEWNIIAIRDGVHLSRFCAEKSEMTPNISGHFFSFCFIRCVDFAFFFLQINCLMIHDFDSQYMIAVREEQLKMFSVHLLPLLFGSFSLYFLSMHTCK
jgi:hypothetical protein